MRTNSFFTKTLCAAMMLAMSSADVVAQNNEVVPIVPSATVLNREFGSHDRESFLTPEKIFYPETWFHFIGGNVSLEGITADLEAIAGAGIQGIHLFHGQFGGKWPATDEDITCLSEKWDDAVKHTAEECNHTDIQKSLKKHPGLSSW